MSLGQKPVFWQDFAKNCMKIKGIGPRRDESPWIQHACDHNISCFLPHVSGSVTTMMLLLLRSNANRAVRNCTFFSFVLICVILTCCNTRILVPGCFVSLKLYTLCKLYIHYIKTKSFTPSSPEAKESNGSKMGFSILG